MEMGTCSVRILESCLSRNLGLTDVLDILLAHLADMGFKFGHNSKRSPAFDAGALVRRFGQTCTAKL